MKTTTSAAAETPVLLDIKDVAKKTGVAVSTLRHWRANDTGPKSARIGRRVRYRAADVDAWIAAQFEEPLNESA